MCALGPPWVRGAPTPVAFRLLRTSPLALVVTATIILTLGCVTVLTSGTTVKVATNRSDVTSDKVSYVC